MIRILLGMLAIPLVVGSWVMGSWASAQMPGGELGRIPGNSMGALHLRVGTLYKSDAMRSWREFLAFAGPDAIRVLEERFQITPLQIDRVTLVVLPAAKPDEPPMGGIPFPFAIMISTQVDISQDRLPERLGIGSLKKLEGPFPMWEEAQTRLVLALPTPRLAILGSESAVSALSRSKDGPAPADFADMGNHDLGLSVRLKSVPQEMLSGISSPFSDLLKADWLRLNVDMGKELRVAGEIRYGSEKEAKGAEEILQGQVKLALLEMEKGRQEMLKTLEGSGQARPAPFSQMPEALGAFYGLATMNGYSEMLKNPPIKRAGDKLEMEMKTELNGQMATAATIGVGVGLLLPAVQKVRQAANRTQGMNNLKLMGLAFHNYESAYSNFPGNITDKKTGKPLLSWRVAILPFIEQDNLYRQFKLDEPWDSEHNLRIAKVAIKVYAPSGAEVQRDGQGNCLTPYQGLAGPSGLLEPGKNIRLRDITDGTSNTVLLLEARKQVIWTKPEDVPFDPKMALPAPEKIFGGVATNGFNALFADGSVRFISNSVDLKVLKALFTRNGGEQLGNGF